MLLVKVFIPVLSDVELLEGNLLSMPVVQKHNSIASIPKIFDNFKVFSISVSTKADI
jgi:hypothetical protein